MKIAQLDHLVLTVSSIEQSLRFYETTLGMEHELFGDNRYALRFGHQKINLHLHGQEFEPKAAMPTPGAAHLCFITTTDLGEVERHLRRLGVAILEGPVERTGAAGPLLSLYIRDPDGNLIEIAQLL